ncbi:cystatin-F-like isoform X2 [Chiloscyllium plagiosum]|uniref:cystatin-F-like isoform X2 n=1 Tax=Chiloscyllium plagiosum TaxID=36176 RepID=UPI001CB7F0C2|nr:cystatin-F-like isoform X2 [Chiloscyllium plagiosum]
MGTMLEVFLSALFAVALVHSDAVGMTEKTPVGPGFLQDVNTTDSGVQNASLIAIYGYNNQSNDIFLYKVQKIHKAQVQVVAGLKYFLYVDIGRTVCRKGRPYNLKYCSFEIHPLLIKRLTCHFELWVVLWKQSWKVIATSCQ